MYDDLCARLRLNAEDQNMKTRMAAASTVETLDSRFQEAFDFIKFAFNIDSLYQDQTELIKVFCNGKNIFFNAPTGYGKSLVFQSLPWVFDIVHEQTIGFSTLIVISPLRSLIEDQCLGLKEAGISCIALYGDNTSNPGNNENEHQDETDIFCNVREGHYSLVYATPECMLGKNSWRKIKSSEEFRDHCIGVVYDEAHIIAQW